MIDAHWLLFLVASLVVIATPGQDMILVMSKSLGHGTRAGLVTAAGVSVGLLGHTLLATLGLGALLRASDTLFVALKLIGAGYLAVLGVQLLRTRATQLETAASAPLSHRRLFLAGALSNLGNPKIAVFFFAFLPQFISPAETRPLGLMLELSGVFMAETFLVFCLYGLAAAAVRRQVLRRPRVLAWLRRLFASAFVALGAKLALAERS